MLASGCDMTEDRLSRVGVVEPGVDASRRKAASLGCSKILFEEDTVLS